VTTICMSINTYNRGFLGISENQEGHTPLLKEVLAMRIGQLDRQSVTELHSVKILNLQD
jgi:hypothetical protein